MRILPINMTSTRANQQVSKNRNVAFGEKTEFDSEVEARLRRQLRHDTSHTARPSVAATLVNDGVNVTAAAIEEGEHVVASAYSVAEDCLVALFKTLF